MFRKNVFPAFAMLLSAVFVQSNASAQAPANYRLSQSVVHLKADVPSYAFNLVTRRTVRCLRSFRGSAHSNTASAHAEPYFYYG
jgi:hypothetical protein